MALEETLELEVAGALRGVDSIDAALVQTTQRFAVNLADALDVLRTPPPLTVVADGLDVVESQVADAITAGAEAADTAVTVTAEGLDAVEAQVSDAVQAGVASADTGIVVEPEGLDAVTAEITDAVSRADTAVSVNVEVTGDTTGIAETTEELGALDAQAGASAEALGNVGSAATIVNTSATLATGQLSGLKQALPSAGLLGGVATGLAAIGGTAALFATGALAAEQAEERWNRALGESAERVAQINVGGLVSDIDALAVSLGSDDEALRLAAADLFEIGRASGAARPELEQTTQQVVALAARAVALRPALGGVGENVNAVANALARGGPRLSEFGLALTAAEIQARALRDTGKQTADELTVYEKSAAGAALATERLGPALGQDIAAGSETGIIRLRALRVEFGNLTEELGAPLTPTFIQILEAAQEPLGEVARIVARLAEEALPLALAALQAAGPAISGVAAAGDVLASALGVVVDLVELIPDPVLQGVVAFGLYRKLLVEVAAATGLYARSKAGEVAATTAGAAADRAAASAKREYATASILAARAQGAASGVAGTLGAAVRGLVSPLGLVTAGLAIGTIALANHRKEQEETRRRVDELSEAFADQAQTLDEDIAARTAERFKDLSGQLRETGVSFADLDGLARQGDQGVFALVERLEASGKLAEGSAVAFREARDSGLTFGQSLNEVVVNVGEVDGSVRKVVEGLGKYQKEVQSAAEETVEQALAAGKFSDAQLKAAEANNATADGATNYFGVLRDLLPAEATHLQQTTAQTAASDELTEATRRQGQAFAALDVEQDTFRRGLDLIGPGLVMLTRHFAASGLTSDEFANALRRTGATEEELNAILVEGRTAAEGFAASYGTNLSRALDEVGPSLGGAIEQFVDGTLTFDEFLNVVGRTPLTVQELDAALKEARSEIESFVDGVVGALPQVGEAFGVLDPESNGLDAFLKETQRQARDAAAFVGNIAALTKRGADDLAAVLLQQGPEVAAKAAADAEALNAKALAKREEQIDASIALEERTQKQAEDLAIEHGLRLAGIVTGNYDLLANIPGPDLRTPLLRTAQDAAEEFDREMRRLGAQVGPGFVDEVGVALRAEQRELRRIAGGLGQEAGDDFAQGLEVGVAERAQALFRAGERAASALDAGVRKQLDIASPSKVGFGVGENWVLSIASGVDAHAPALGAASARAAQRMVLNVPAAVVGGPTAPPVGPTGSVTHQTNITVNEVANDPMATAWAVDAVQGRAASR